MQSTVSRSVTANIRAELARRDLRQPDLATALNMHPMSVSKRMTGQVGWSIDEVQAAADWFGIPLVALLEAAS